MNKRHKKYREKGVLLSLILTQIREMVILAHVSPMKMGNKKAIKNKERKK